MIKKQRIACPSCGRRKDEDLFDHDVGICVQCSERAHKAALEYSALHGRDRGAHHEAAKALSTDNETNRLADRDRPPTKDHGPATIGLKRDEE
jgi:hypothetical protein